ncbi:hypothetical protein F4678DRAFT_378999 [Xylaria arbuscula]|nr:hypothetical protein F4678DRAFT_378999 [Xylaria arbuscula]
MLPRKLVAGGVPALSNISTYLTALIIPLSTITLGLAAYADSLCGKNYYYESNAPAYLVFVSSWTLFVYAGVVVLARYAPRFYNRFGVLVCQALAIIFWMTGWVWAASWAAYTLSFDNYSPSDSIRGPWKSFGQTIAACAGIGSVVWVLCITAFIFFCYSCNYDPSSAPRNSLELANVSKPNIPRRQTPQPANRPSLSTQGATLPAHDPSL